MSDNMNIIINNNICVERPTKAIIDYCNNRLVIDNPDYINAKKMGRYLGNIPPKMQLYVKRNGDLIIPFGCLTDIWKLAKGASYDCQIHSFKGSNLVGGINLYSYQEKAVAGLKSGKNGVLQAPCGSGKTQMGLALIKEIGGRALWLTHTEKLLEQSLSRCKTYFQGDFGTITQGEVNIGRDITFATVQTMSKLDASMYRDEFDIIVVDECHHCVGSPTKVMQFYKILSNCNARYKYGLSATLSRADNLITTMYAIIGKVLYTINQSDIGNKIIKAEHKKVDIDIKYNYQDYLDTDGTISYMKLIDLLSSNLQRDKIIVNQVKECYQQGKKQLLLCHRVKQVEQLARMIKEFADVDVIVGKVKQSKRNYSSNIIVATYALAKEGLDIPTLDVLHLVTPQKNESTTEQAIGRIERNVEGKAPPICFDYVDTDIDYCVNCYKKRRRIINRKNKN